MVKSTKVEKNFLSTTGDILIVVDQMAQYLFFRDVLPKIPAETLRKTAENSPALKTYLYNLQHLKQTTQKQPTGNTNGEQGRS
jgi:hypothetical protein